MNTTHHGERAGADADAAEDVPRSIATTLTPLEFVRVWQASDTLADFCAATGMRHASASQRAWSFRRRGIRLKPMPRASTALDIEALARLAESMSDEESEEERGRTRKKKRRLEK